MAQAAVYRRVAETARTQQTFAVLLWLADRYEALADRFRQPTRCSARCSARLPLRDVTGDDEVMTAPLSVLGLTLRSSNALLNNGFSTVGDLLPKTETEIVTLPHIGPIVLADIKAKLSARGLTLHPGSRRLPGRTL
jgi:DNA-directed RNA polymerase alpha subunit